MRHHLALVLSRYADQPLTLEVARAILRDAVPDEDRSIPLGDIPVRHWNGYTLQAERIAGNEAALAPLHQAYHEETKATPFDLNFDYARLREAERAGTLLMFTARTAAGELVGVMRVRLWTAIESQHLVACDDMFYVRPAHRGWLSVELWKATERAAFDYGVREVTFDSLTINGAERMARFLGYRQVAIKFHKVAQDSSDYSKVPTRHAKE